MKKINLLAAALLLMLTGSVNFRAQVTEKKEPEKPKTTTIDAWREAFPQAEQNSGAPLVVDEKESTDNVEAKETPAQIEKRILDLEQRLMASVKGRDAVMLDHLIADDFVLAGLNIAGTQSDKNRFIGWALKNLELKSYELQKTTVRAYSPSAAIVSYQYKRQAAVAGAPASGDFIVTDVWVKRAKRWQAVSQHISQLTK